MAEHIADDGWRVNVGYTEQPRPIANKPKRHPAGRRRLQAGRPADHTAGRVSSKFMFEPGMIMVYIEQASMARFIQLNTEHNEARARVWAARWGTEGDTLVVTRSVSR
jgi:hypothetical protein